jgi:hypothetical protein
LHCHKMPFTFWKKYSQEIDLLEAVVGPIVDGTDGAYFVKTQIYEQILRTQSRTLEMKKISFYTSFTHLEHANANTCTSSCKLYQSNLRELIWMQQVHILFGIPTSWISIYYQPTVFLGVVSTPKCTKNIVWNPSNYRTTDICRELILLHVWTVLYTKTVDNIKAFSSLSCTASPFQNPKGHSQSGRHWQW